MPDMDHHPRGRAFRLGTCSKSARKQPLVDARTSAKPASRNHPGHLHALPALGEVPGRARTRVENELDQAAHGSMRWSRHSARDVLRKCDECERLRMELKELKVKHSDLQERYRSLVEAKAESSKVKPIVERDAAVRGTWAVQPNSGAMQLREAERSSRYRVGISYETAQQQTKYIRVAEKAVHDLKLRASVQQGAMPEKEYDIVLHFARTEGGRTVNLDLEKRMAFTCKHVILVLLRSGKNESVFSKFVPTSKSEYSGINLGSSNEKKCIVQLLHWQGEWIASTLNNENLQLLKHLMGQACPGISP